MTQSETCAAYQGEDGPLTVTYVSQNPHYYVDRVNLRLLADLLETIDDIVYNTIS